MMSTTSRGIIWRLALLVVLLLSLAWCGPPRAYAVDHTHTSSRFDRSPAALHRQLVRFTHTSTTVITVTEVQERVRARQVARLRGWGHYTPSRSDLGVAWDRSVWRLAREQRVTIARISYVQWNGYRVWVKAAGVLLVNRATGFRLLVTVAHLPAGIYTPHGWRHGREALRARVWRSAVHGWAQQTRRWDRHWDADGVLVTGDWNVSFKSSFWRAVIRAQFPRLLQTWRSPYPHGGTLGRSLYDGTLTNMRGRARLAPDDASSDHRPFRERLVERTLRS